MLKDMVTLFGAVAGLVLVIGIAVPIAQYAMSRRGYSGSTISKEGNDFLVSSEESEIPVVPSGSKERTSEQAGLGLKLDRVDLAWGNISRGASTTETVCITALQDGSTFSMYTQNWQPPEAEKYLTLSWDYDNRTLRQDEAMQVSFTLSVSPLVEGITSFNFDIIIVCSVD